MSKALGLIKNVSFDSAVSFPIKLTDKIIIHDFYNGSYPFKEEIFDWVKKEDNHWGSYPCVWEILDDIANEKSDPLFQSLKFLTGLIRLTSYNRAFLAHILFFNSSSLKSIISNDNHYGLFSGDNDRLTQKDINDFVKNILLLKTAKDNKRLSTAIYYWNMSSGSETYENALIQLFIALESLLTTDKIEVTYKLAHRFSWLYTNDSQERLEIFKKLKKGYNSRGNVVHGGHFVDINELELVKKIHSMSRKIILKILETKSLFNGFTGTEQKLNDFLDSLALGNEIL